jgi:uncharacterized coiled-coil protein SlyX
MTEDGELIELQTRLVFQEDVITQLEQVQEQQRQELDSLRRLVGDLSQQLEELRVQLGSGLPTATVDEKPPHY